MEASAIKIVPFELSHQPGIDLLFNAIQKEFREQVFPDPSQTIAKLSRSPDRIYWVALADEKVIGTVGLLFLADNCCCLKSMFLSKEFRSDKRQIAQQLFQKANDHVKEQKCKMICLGTMAQFKGAQHFYEKNGFIRVAKEQLPSDFPANSVDTVFYLKML